MLHFFQPDGTKLVQLDGMPEHLHQPLSDGETANSPDCWVNLADPSEEELQLVSEQFNIPRDYFIDSLDIAERPHLMHNDHCTLIIARVSTKPQDTSKYKYSTVPVGIIITPKAVVTVCRDAETVLSLVEHKIHDGQSRERVRIALTVLQQISIRFIEHLEEFDRLTGDIEAAMRQSTRNEDLSNMMQLEKNLVYFLTALKSNALVLDTMLTSTSIHWEKGEKELLVDALTESRQAVSMAEIYSQVTSNMNDIFTSMVSNNMNSVVKFLTAVTLILMAPTIIVGLYGMNIPLPLQESTFALPLVGAGTVGVCWLLWRYLQKKHWM